MKLQPLPSHEPFQTLEAGLKYINDYARAQGYAVVIAHTKNSKKDDKRKTWIRCDQGGKTHGPTGFGRRQHTTEQSSQRIPSQFEGVEADMTIQHTQEQEEEQEKDISDTAPAVQSQDQPRGGRRGRRGPRGPRGQRGRGGRGVGIPQGLR